MPTERYDFARYLNVRTAYAASFSPDGKHLSFLTDITGVAEVWRVAVESPDTPPRWPEQLTFRGERVASATFAPNADMLLLEADTGGSERTQLSLISADGTTVTPLSDLPDVIYQFGGWSPDGARICYASNARDQRYFDVYEMDVATRASRVLAQQDGTNYASGYSHDGGIVLVLQMDSNVKSTLLAAETQTGLVWQATPDHADAHGLHVSPAFSADGKGIYLLSDQGRQFMTLAYLDLATQTMTYLRDDPWNAEALALSDDGTRLALVTNENGHSRLELFDVSAGWDQRRNLYEPSLRHGVIREVTWSRDGTRVAFTFDAAEDNPDVWIVDVVAQQAWQATHSARGGIPREAFIAPTLIHYPTFDGREIPAFLYLPRDVSPRGLPVVVYVHGGPESQFRPSFNPVVQYLAGQGYAVLAPNVRGSSGYGYEYQSLDDVRLRMDSVADLRAAALWLAESGTADPKRIAVMGGSYGGFMVLAAVTTYPDLWAAGVDIVGIANFVTFLENTGPWRRKLREPEYGSLENDRDFLESISPIRSVDKITAPLFVIHGVNDPRVPVGEAEQIVAALRARNVPVEYLRFDDEGHGLIKRANRLLAYPAVARFLDERMRQQ
ncbi:MAG: peptidase S9, prolyl oligopeptidase active site region [Ktedonobacterales bacterium]|nr:MAG: peptidase S9, prolyl oligopeptidase active site region [Ktedonobacterales bacterium]